jgi:tetratricopeptide (TPR) repeat protein
MARAALQLDEALPEAHNALAMSLFLYGWDWAGAEKEFRRALTLNPNYALAHQWYGQFEKAMGRKNWTARVRRAHELDPLALIIAGAGQYRASGRDDLAIENMRKKLELDPDFALTHRQLGDVYVRRGMYQDAVEQFQKALDLSGGAPPYLGALGYAYGVAGKRVDAIKVLKRFALLSKRRYVSPYDIAVVHAGLGEKDEAFSWLQKALAERSSELVFLKWDYKIETLRSDPRYGELLRSVGLPH